MGEGHRTAPAVPPTDGARERSRRKARTSINFFSAWIGSRWVYINFEGRTGGRRKNGAFNGDMKHILTARYLLGLCQIPMLGTQEDRRTWEANSNGQYVYQEIITAKREVI